MFNSDQLTEQYRRSAKEIHPAPGHEENIRTLYESDRMRRGRSKSLKPVAVKVLLALVVVVVFSGFNRYIWLKISDHRMSLHYSQTNTRIDNAELSSAIHRELQQVEASLGVGEAAIAYLPELAKWNAMDKKKGLVVVSNPTVITDLSAWKTILAKNTPEFKLPTETSTGLEFVGGKEGPPFGGFISLELQELLPELTRESEEQGGKIAWRKVIAENQSHSYTTLYRNDRQDVIYVSMQLIDQKTDIRIGTGLMESEEINVHGAKAHYLQTQPFFFADSNRVQEIQWLATFEKYTLLYSVGSDSSTLTKEELLRVALELK
ncbi:hypothetical protein [Paenibacillus guangzhouensis]|uniref:hypothetical protein n=1 Tax=Paenibacillus guangzhouensis TaxID=1473112 RepID=UPI001266D2C5|nr:hypothetical protein [Paenibacillus guangzhouensis]